MKLIPQLSNAQKKAEIHWGDETGININTNYQKTYSPKGITPTVKIKAKNFTLHDFFSYKPRKASVYGLQMRNKCKII